jgi:hypothetical protein
MALVLEWWRIQHSAVCLLESAGGFVGKVWPVMLLMQFPIICHTALLGCE